MSSGKSLKYIHIKNSTPHTIFRKRLNGFMWIKKAHLTFYTTILHLLCVDGGVDENKTFPIILKICFEQKKLTS